MSIEAADMARLCDEYGVGRARLHVHHRTYARRGYERLADVTVLCAGCHKTFHENRWLS